MLRAGIILALLGLAAAIGLVAWHGADDVLEAFGAAGWGIVWASLYHIFPLIIAARGWQVLMPGRGRPGLGFMWLVLWLRVSMNNLLPVARIGGEVLAARVMIKHGISKATAVASVVVDTTVSVITVLMFSLTGILLLAWHDPGTDIMLQLLAGVAVAAPVVAALVAVQRAGFFGLFAKMVKWFGGDRLKEFAGTGARFDRAIRAMYRRRGRVFESGFWILLSWMSGAGNIWLALWFLGHPLSVLDCLIIEAMIQAASSLAFAVPAALGAQEGAFFFFGGLLGLSPEVALALALMRRCRDIIIYVPGLIAWQIKEGHWLLRKKTA
ncbi:MAG: flippase-like domain-containing protein [Alphaproteobacteria bacterium]|nr:flippase-like domain-containing protein [Alphaproteobacteria bacterium]